jgi:hypothetical protein
MGKMITAILAIAVISGAAYYALTQASRGSTADGVSAPRRELDNVRGAASRIESDADQRARDLESKMGDGQ